MRWVSKAMLDGRCICEVDEYGGPPEPIADIRARLCQKVADWVLTEWSEVVDHYWVERYQDDKPVWDKRPLARRALEIARSPVGGSVGQSDTLGGRINDEIRNTNGTPRPIRVRPTDDGEVEIRHVPRPGSGKAHLIILTQYDACRLASLLIHAADCAAGDVD